MESVTKTPKAKRPHNSRKNSKATPAHVTSETAGTKAAVCPRCGGDGFYVPENLPLGHRDFGRAIPCECKKQEQEETRRNNLLNLSHIGALREYTFDTFIVESPGIPEKMNANLEIARRTTLEFADHPTGWLILQGGYGCGKTHLAAAIANYQLDQGRQVLFVNTPDLLDHLRATFNPESTVTYDDRFEQIRTVPLLILDDLGTQSNSAWAQEKLYQIINYRYTERLPTVITTNLDEMDFEPRIRSRMFHEQEVTRILRIQARDFRRGLLQQDQSELSTLDYHRHLTFDTFIVVDRKDLQPNQQKHLREVQGVAYSYAEKVWKQEAIRPWLVLSSTEHGNGKTHLAAAIANHVANSGERVLFVVVPDLLDYLRGAFDPTSKIGLDKRFDEIRKNRSLVVLDDLGTESATPFVREKLYQLFNYRYVAGLPTVITTAAQLDRLDSHLASRMSDESRCNFQILRIPSFYKAPTFDSRGSSKAKPTSWRY